MKKLFSIFCCLLLSASMATQAQLRNAANDTSNAENIPAKANLIKGRNNAPQAVYTISWQWEGDSHFDATQYKFVGTYSGYKVYQYVWDNDLLFFFSWSSGLAGSWYYATTGETYVMPPTGTYTIQQNIGDKKIANWDSQWTGTGAYTNSIYVDSSTEYWYDGSLKIEEGADGPYIHNATSSSVRTTPDGRGCYNYNLTIGSKAHYNSVTVQSESNTKGTVSYSMKSGYVYTPTTHFKDNSVYTLTATPKTGYHFVCWKNGNTQISTNPTTDVTITGNATYTAYFESNAATQYTISTAVSPVGYGTVSGAGQYYENDQATLTATSANAHLYFFDHWLKDGVTYEGGTTITPTVTAAATYTAVFRAAAAGTITGVAAHGTISGTGNYAGGTAVQLGVTAADGYVFTQWSDGNQDNPRTVYVDGNATYTAQFVQGVNVNTPHSVLTVYDSNGNELEVGAGSYFNVRGNNGEYSFIIESASIAFSATTYNYSQLEQSSTYTWLKHNGSNVALDYTKSSITFTQTEYYNYHQTYNVSATLVGTDGTRYQISTVASRFVYFDTDDDYAFPYMDYNFAAPSFRESIPEDYNPGAWSYNADSKWLYLKTTLSGSDYYIRLAFNVAGSSIPTGTYTLGTSNSSSLISNYATPVYDLYTDCGWPQQVDGSNVFAWGDDAYWWFFHSGTINVVNTNGVYYVEVDAYNTRAQNIRFTMGTPPVVSYNLAWDANGGELSGTYTAAGSVNEGTSITAPTATRTGYTFTGWSPAFTGTMPSANTTYTAQWTPSTYTVTVAKSNNGYGTLTDESDNVRVINNVPYGTVITTGTGENANKVTINGTTVTATPAANDAQYSYAFSGWTNGAATVTGNMTVTANFTRTVNTYDITFKDADGTTLKKSDGTTDAIYTVAYGATPAYDGATPTKAADSEYTYTFNAWTPAITSVTDAATYTATYSTTKVQYTLTWDVNGGNELTGTYTNGTIDWGTAITKPADPTKSGYTFNGWDADNDGTADDVAATMPTNNVTYKALWTAASPNITLCEKCDNSHYNTFKATYGGSAGVGVNVTYKRQFTASRWSTMCLPFSLDLATMIANKMYGCVYEFKYATGNANVGSGVNLYFSNAKSIEAGKCYIVNANSALAEKTSFVFSGVTIDLSKDNGADLSSPETPEASVAAYNALPGYKSEGTIELVGTLRNGILMGTATGNKYMGLKENKIYYPNTDTGSTIWAYRGIFRSSSELNVEKMRIVVDGEDRGEIRIDNGELIIDNGSPVRKFIRNGNLYIEREGVIYDAQGKRVE